MPESLAPLNSAQLATIDEAVADYIARKDHFSRVAKTTHDNLLDYIEHSGQEGLIHSMKFRLKDPEHLRRKLIRKALDEIASNTQPLINKGNLAEKIDDLAGVRILHLHTEQVRQIDLAIRAFLHEQMYELVEGPIANTWDPEYAQFFSSLGMTCLGRPSLYTSVHYVVSANDRAKTRCEIQVRTLMEEVWGEVSHLIDYPDRTESIACNEQLKVLARVTSSGTRLVDSIIKSHIEYQSRRGPRNPSPTEVNPR